MPNRPTYGDPDPFKALPDSGTGLSDRITRLETLLHVIHTEQNSSRERIHDMSNVMTSAISRLEKIDNKLSDADLPKVNLRIGSLEDSRSKVLFGWVLFKWSCAVTGAFFTTSLFLGEKLSKLPIWGFLK